MTPDEIIKEIEKKEDDKLVLNKDIKADLLYYETIKDDILRDINKLNSLKKQINSFMRRLDNFEIDLASRSLMDLSNCRKAYNIFVNFKRDDECIIAITFTIYENYKTYIDMPNDWVWNVLDDKYLKDEHDMTKWCDVIKEYLEKKYNWKIIKRDDKYYQYIPKEHKEKKTDEVVTNTEIDYNAIKNGIYAICIIICMIILIFNCIGSLLYIILYFGILVWFAIGVME